jgi:hypothetical protein
VAAIAQEIAAAEEGFGAGRIEDDLGVHGAGHAQADLERQVAFDEAGDDFRQIDGDAARRG